LSARHGRNGRFYANVTSAGTAEPIPFLNKWSVNFTGDYPEVTAFGDPNKVYVAGLPDFSGTIAGFYDDATAQFYTAAVDGAARKFYLYPDIVNKPARYWFGTAFLDFSMDGGTADGIAISSSIKAASAVGQVG
jgi:hypothetical protein